MKRASVCRRLLALVIVVAMLAAMAMPALAEQNMQINFTQVDNSNVSAKLPGRDEANLPNPEKGYDNNDIVRVSIFLDRNSVLAAGFSPENATGYLATLYRDSLKKDQEKLTNRIERVIGGELDVVWNLTLAANLISANVAYGQIEAIESMAGVECVVIETLYQPDMTEKGEANPNMATSGEQTGTAPAWAAGYTGAGTRIAIIDTGLDMLHEAFDPDAYLYSLGQIAAKKGMTADEYIESLDLLDAEEIAGVLDQLNAYNSMGGIFGADDLNHNAKVPFGYSYIDDDVNMSHYNSEHGSHVAGISAANAYVADGEGFVPAMNTTCVQGVAPDAQLLIMKVFGTKGGAYEADYFAAIEDAIVLGADSVNLSLGSGNPGMDRNSTAKYQALLESLDDCGVTVVMSAGNSGSWVESADNAGYLYADDVSMHTGGSPGTFTNSFGVASVNNAGYTLQYISVGGALVLYTESAVYGNEPISSVAGEYDYIFLNNIGTEEQFAELGEDLLRGKVVLCYRGETSFFEKANAAASRGAKAIIIVNNQPGTIGLNLTGYEYSAPVVSVQQADGEYFKAAGEAVAAADGSVWYWTGKVEISDKPAVGSYEYDYYTMSSFSSWGVPGSLTLKPEITAPGGNIYSVAGMYNDPTNGMMFTDHASYELMSGTSMAAPQVTGMAALMAQYIEENGLDALTGLTARQLAQSLLMSTAVPIIDGNSGCYYPVLQQGAGLANVGAAMMADSYILMGEDATASYADGKVKAELGDDPYRTGYFTFTFTINNLEDVDKLYNLSADFFIQAPVSDGRNMYMYDLATLIGALTTFTVDGKPVDAEFGMTGADFNGDGVVNIADGQALLDYTTGASAQLSNTEVADLDADGDIDSYDAYLFLATASSLTNVPAGGSVEVEVEIQIPATWRSTIDYYFPNGTYLQGYVYAEGIASQEGVAGTSHSIPVLGFYGNWSDPSMFDKGSVMEYMYGEETRIPYLYSNTLANGLSNGIIFYDADGNEYWFGGNPMVDDGVYLPERNAISSVNGTGLKMLGFSTIRNAAAAYFQIWNSETGAYYANQKVMAPMPSAYFHVNNQVWDYTYRQLNFNFNGAGLPNNTPIEVGVTAVPEYYVDAKGNVDWAALGDGATFSMPMTVDNEAPVLKNVSMSLIKNTLNLRVSDNQYIAAVALFDIYGQYLYTYEGADLEQIKGGNVEYALDLTGVAGPSFLLQVYDYAMNTTTYQVDVQIGEVTDELDGVVISTPAIVLQKGNSNKLSAVVYPVNAASRGVVWSSSDESVAVVNADGVVTAVGEGEAYIIATAEANADFYAVCRVTVIDINQDLNGIIWDEEGSIWFSEFNTTTLPDYTKLSRDMLGIDDYLVAATMGPDGTLYASSFNSSTGEGAIYVIDTDTYKATKLSDCVVQGLHIFYSDLTYVPAMFGTGMILGSYGPYIMAIDPATGTTLGIIDQYDSEVVGITTCYGIYDPYYDEYQDVVYVIQNDGTVIQEIYYGYSGAVVPYFDYFYGMRISMDSGISVGDTWYFNSAYYDAESALLFWSAFDYAADDNDVELFAIDADYSGDVYSLGTFGESVWPVGGLYEADDYDYTYTMGKLNFTAEQRAVIDAKAIEMQSFKLVKQEMTEKKSNNEALLPMSSSSITDKETLITVTVTAKDFATNGVSTITFDSAALELVKVDVMGDYISVNQGEGSVTVGFVALGTIAPDAPVAVLKFLPVSNEDTTVTVKTQINNSAEISEEVLTVEYPHNHTEVRDAKDATATEDGYTGDIWCRDCGKLIAKGEVIPKLEQDDEVTTEPSEDVEDTTEPSEDVEDATEPSEDVEDATEPSEDVEDATEPSEDVEDATEPSEDVEDATEPSEDVEDATEPSEDVEDATEPSEDVEDTTEPTVEVEVTPEPTLGAESNSSTNDIVVDTENPATSESYRTILAIGAGIMLAAVAAIVVLFNRKKWF